MSGDPTKISMYTVQYNKCVYHTTPHHTTPHHTTPHHTTPHHTTPHHTTPHHTTPHHTTPHHTRYLYMQGCHKRVLTSMSTVMQYADKQENVYTNLSRSFRNPIEYFSDSHASSLRTTSIYVRRNALQRSMRLETQKVSMHYNFYKIANKINVLQTLSAVCISCCFRISGSISNSCKRKSVHMSQLKYLYVLHSEAQNTMDYLGKGIFSSPVP